MVKRSVNRILLGVLLLVSAAALTSCSIDNGSSSPLKSEHSSDQQAEWTVLFYGAGNTDLDAADTQSQVLAAIGNLEGVYTANTIQVVALAGSHASDGICRMYEVNYHPHTDSDYIRSHVLSEWGRADLSSPQTLRKFIATAAVLFPAHHYALIIAGYGDGWRGACRDDVNGAGSLMPISAIREAITTSSTVDNLEARLSLLALIGPEMNTIEVAYELRNAASYLVASSSVSPRLHPTALRQWLLDLTLDPSMSGDRVGHYLVSRIQQTAVAANDTLTTAMMLDLPRVGNIGAVMNEFARQLEPVATTQSLLLANIRHQIWNPAMDDSANVDLFRLISAIQSHPDLQQYPALQSAAANAYSVLNGAVLLSRTSNLDDSIIRGLMIHFPCVADIDNQYLTLSFTQDWSNWTAFLDLVFSNHVTPVTLTGTVRNPGQALGNVYFFLNTVQVGAPVIALSGEITLLNFTAPNEATFQGSFLIEGDSLGTYIGLFQDLDHSSSLTAGDRYGYYRVTSSLRDWITLHNGDALNNVFIELNRTY